MPLIKLQTIATDTQLGVWKIEEDFDFFTKAMGTLLTDSILTNSKLPEKRRLEYTASRFLVQQLCKMPVEVIKDEFGKPFINNSKIQLSLSHTNNYAAVVISKHFLVGVDIEPIHERVHKVQHKFLGSTENAWLGETPQSDMVTLCWSAKESLYKLYGKKQLDFIKHLSLQKETDNTLKGKIAKGDFNREYLINNEVIENNQLTYVVDV